ncbi:Protein CHROMATIN REMODELING 20 [Cytospora mali]|uniref:Protein CHROMATIN REMODELING 20 n=1 Tax=Cytospora mali TaxID=578113 RepID=A0A194VF56_CYTMA|nr:Protein CHROMATIN REMODELING 20 [Valsa mali var. pyri (nom. inval.)]
MAEGSTGDDPFNWEVDRVVKELCTMDRIWKPTPNSKLPDPKELAEKLRDGEYDGELLLLSSEKELYENLGITRPKFKAALQCAVRQFRQRSKGYKKWMEFLNGTNDGTDLDQSNHQQYQQQSEVPTQAFTPISDNSGPATAQPVEMAQKDADAREIDHDLPNPPSKKRRLATSAMITTDRASLPQGQLFNNIAAIPTEADNISFIPTKANNVSSTTEKLDDASPSPNQTESVRLDHDAASMSNKGPAVPSVLLPEDVGENCRSKPGAYWGNGKLLRSEILNISTTMDADSNIDFGWGEPKPFGKARKRYVHRTVQRHLLYPERRTVVKKDTVLPAYGESDIDDDNPEWDEIDREIQEEEEEARLEKEVSLGLEPSEVDACLERMVEECAARWHETRLANEKHKAYAMWKEVHKHGTRRAEVQILSTELRNAEKSLEKTLKGLKDNQYSSETELRRMSPFLEPRVQPMEHIKWLIRILNNPNAPEKVARPKTQVQRERRPRSAEDSIDLWSEDELEDQMRNFIVDDDLAQETDAFTEDRHGTPMNADAMDIDQPAASEISAELSQSFASSTDENIEMHDLTNIDHESDVDDQVLNDLVIRQTPKPDLSHTSPDSRNPSLSDLQAIVRKGSLYWESKRDAKRLIITLIWTQPPVIRKGLFKILETLEPEQCWDRFIEVPSKYPDAGLLDLQTKFSPNTAHLFSRLFNVHVQGFSGSSMSLRSWNIVPTSEWARETKQYFESFWEFLTSIKPKSSCSEQPRPEPSSPEPARHELASPGSSSSEPSSPDDSQVQRMPAAKSKGRKDKYQKEKEASQQFRDRDGRRQREQQARRLLLRQQVQGSEISQEQSRLIINESKLDDQNLVYVHPHISPLIKDHQIDGVRFMWDQLLSESNQGCLLAHTMGLGKTMQVVTLLTAIQDAATSSDPKVSCQIPDHLKESRTLILCPAGLLNNWMDELLYWAPEGLLGELFTLDSTLSENERAETVQDWAERGGVLIIGYPMLTQIAKRKDLLELLLDKPSIVISDEAHHLKNEKSEKSKIASRFKTHSRLALTGSPLANNVSEYYAMIHWVAPDFLGDKKWFDDDYTSPISRGLYEDSTKKDRRIAKIRLAALRQIVAPKVHRRTVGTLKDSLPPKKEYIIHLDIRSVQREVYLTLLRGVKGKQDGSKVALMWSLISYLGILLAHPKILHAKLQRDKQNRGESHVKEDVNMENSEDGEEKLPTQVQSDALEVLATHQGYDELKTSFKMLALFKILDKAAEMGENVLVFSQSLVTLDFIEEVCSRQRRPYKRLDGSTKVSSRQSQVKEFNLGRGQTYLISTRAGGVGLNIYGASRVVVFDFQFNPVDEQQAIGRSYRIGQTKPVVVYWLICDGTFEKTLHNQQVFKNQLASGVVDKKDLLPKARQLTEYFMEPQQLPHQDLTAYKGQDLILDAMIESTEVSEGISSICTTETFEEEDTQQLADEDQREAENLARNIAKKKTPAEYQVYYHQPSQQFSEVRLVSGPPNPTSISAIHTQNSASAPAVSAAAESANPRATSSVTVADTRAKEKPFSVAYGSGSHPGTFPATPATNLQPPIHTPAYDPESNATSANFATQMMPPTWSFPQAPLSQISKGGHHHGTAYQQCDTNGLVIPFNFLDPGWNQRALSSATTNSGSSANSKQLPVQHPASPGPVDSSGVQGQSVNSTPCPMPLRAMPEGMPMGVRPATTAGATEPDAVAAVAPGQATLMQGISPTSLGTTQMGHAPATNGSGNAVVWQDNAPMSMDATLKRNAAALDDKMGEFQRELERQAPVQLRQRVAVVITQLEKSLTGGRLQRSMHWDALKDQIRGRPDRAGALLGDRVPLQNVIEHAKNGGRALGVLLDVVYTASLSEGKRDTKDPDHSQRMLQRSISSDDKAKGESSRKAEDIMALREVWKNRESKLQRSQKPGKPEEPKKTKNETLERRRRTMSVIGAGGTSSDPVVIDD